MSNNTREDVFKQAAAAANDVLGFPGTGVREYDEQRKELKHVVFGGRVADVDARPPFDIQDTPHGEAWRTEETVIYDPVDDDPYDLEVFTQAMYVPIGKYGVLSLGTVGQPFDDVDKHFAELLANNTEAALTMVEQKSALRTERERLHLLKEIFSRVLRHNLRNELTVIRGNAEAIMQRGGETVGDFAQNIIDGCSDLLSTTEKTRRIEQVIDSPDEMVQLMTDDLLTKAVDAVVEQYQYATVEFGTTERVEIEVHPQFHLALENLVENAIVHADDPEPTVTVSAIEEGQTVTFEVVDRGPGIPTDEYKTLQVETETDLTHGSGAGLWLVQWLVTVSDGELKFDIQENGTAVQIKV